MNGTCNLVALSHETENKCWNFCWCLVWEGGLYGMFVDCVSRQIKSLPASTSSALAKS